MNARDILFGEPQRDLLTLVQERLGLRNSAYKGENAFGYIADRWNLWILQTRLGRARRLVASLTQDPSVARQLMTEIFDTFSLTPADIADMMVEFKRARRALRQSAGAPELDDDLVDEAGYMYWVHRLIGESERGNNERETQKEPEAAPQDLAAKPDEQGETSA